MQAITNETNGIVKVDGDTWTAVADAPIDTGEKVVVKREIVLYYK